MTAAVVAALTVYDMTKALDKGIRIREVVLVSKTGGKSRRVPPSDLAQVSCASLACRGQGDGEGFGGVVESTSREKAGSSAEAQSTHASVNL